MNNRGTLGIITGILLICFLLIGAVSASVIINGLDTTTTTSGADLNQITNEVVDELSAYINIKDIVGKYQTFQGEQKIQQIALLIRPLVSQNIDMTHMIIKISSEKQYNILYFNGNVSPLGSFSLFDHPHWQTITENTYTLLSIIDDDASMSTSYSLNKNTDTAFLLIKLPLEGLMRYGDVLQITLLPTPGTQRTVTLEAPLPTTHVVTLYG